MKKLIIVLGVIAVFCVGMLAYMGAFDKVEIVEVEIPAMNLVYVAHVGSYYEVGPVMADLHERIEAAGVTSGIGAGIYLDDPILTGEEELRSVVGDIVTTEELALLEGKGFDVLKIENGKGVMGEFPYKNIFSYMLAPMKVYPEVAAYMAEREIEPRGGMEVYDMEKEKIMIYMELGESYDTKAKALFLNK